MRLTQTELKAVGIIVGKYLDRISKSIFDPQDKNIVGVTRILNKIKTVLGWGLGPAYEITDQKKEKIRWAMDASNSLIERYARTRDMSLTFEYDRMKKECGLIMSLLADLKADFDTGKEVIKSDLKTVFYRISEEYRAEDKKMSTAAADRLAEIDDRYVVAKEEFRLYMQTANLIRTRYDVIKDIHQAIVQSVSTARVGMIQESYTDDGGKQK